MENSEFPLNQSELAQSFPVNPLFDTGLSAGRGEERRASMCPRC